MTVRLYPKKNDYIVWKDEFGVYNYGLVYAPATTDSDPIYYYVGKDRTMGIDPTRTVLVPLCQIVERRHTAPRGIVRDEDGYPRDAEWYCNELLAKLAAVTAERDAMRQAIKETTVILVANHERQQRFISPLMIALEVLKDVR